MPRRIKLPPERLRAANAVLKASIEIADALRDSGVDAGDMSIEVPDQLFLDCASAASGYDCRIEVGGACIVRYYDRFVGGREHAGVPIVREMSDG